MVQHVLSGPRPVASVARALALLDELAASETGLGVNELARRIDVNPSTALVRVSRSAWNQVRHPERWYHHSRWTPARLRRK